MLPPQNIRIHHSDVNLFFFSPFILFVYFLSQTPMFRDSSLILKYSSLLLILSNFFYALSFLALLFFFFPQRVDVVYRMISIRSMDDDGHSLHPGSMSKLVRLSCYISVFYDISYCYVISSKYSALSSLIPSSVIHDSFLHSPNIAEWRRGLPSTSTPPCARHSHQCKKTW